VYNNLAFGHIQLGLNNRPDQLDAALLEVQAALAADPTLPAARYNRAWARFERYVDHATWIVSDPDAVAQLDRDIEDLLANPPAGPQPYFLAARVGASAKDADEARLVKAVDHIRTAITLGLTVKSATNDPVTRCLRTRPDFRALLDTGLVVPPVTAHDPALVAPPAR